MIILRIHPDTFPRTDHGYTWVQSIWYEQNGEWISPIIPSAGCCERLGSMPGGPVRCDFVAEERRYATDGVARIENMACFATRPASTCRSSR